MVFLRWAVRNPDTNEPHPPNWLVLPGYTNEPIQKFFISSHILNFTLQNRVLVYVFNNLEIII